MILDVIVEDKKKRLKEHKARTSEEQMKELALVSERKSISFYEALAKPGLSIIGEFKKASPSMGKIEMTMELMDRIDEYNVSVDAISCLNIHFLALFDHCSNRDTEIHISVKVNVTDCSAVKSSSYRFQFIDNLHRSYLWRTT